MFEKSLSCYSFQYCDDLYCISTEPAAVKEKELEIMKSVKLKKRWSRQSEIRIECLAHKILKCTENRNTWEVLSSCKKKFEGKGHDTKLEARE